MAQKRAKKRRKQYPKRHEYSVQQQLVAKLGAARFGQLLEEIREVAK